MPPQPKCYNINFLDFLCIREQESDDEIFDDLPELEEIDFSSDEEENPYPAITDAYNEVKEYINGVIDDI